MKIAYRDFERTKKYLGLSLSPFYDAVYVANQWIAERNVDVIDVETLIVVTGATAGGAGSVCSTPNGIRVWYRI
jgi:DNA-binding beta-propeller fold protein YncE